MTLERPAPAFHEGEVALQAEAGVDERMARVGQQVLRKHLPEQHQLFYAELPFVLVGSVDAAGQPTASLLAGPPGFLSAPDSQTLHVAALPCAGDPLERRLEPGQPLGLLGIRAHERRRNRANGRVVSRDAAGFSLRIDQAYGNCPRFIVPREARYSGADGGGAERMTEGVIQCLDDRARALVSGADTFYIASAHPAAPAGGDRAYGVDVSHRGGPAGFAHLTGSATFSIPEFRGNQFYNTLGNLRLNPRAGLLFIDFEQGHLLQLEARAELVAGAHPHAEADGTGRVLRFQVERARWFPRAARLRFTLAGGG